MAPTAAQTTTPKVPRNEEMKTKIISVEFLKTFGTLIFDRKYMKYQAKKPFLDASFGNWDIFQISGRNILSNLVEFVAYFGGPFRVGGQKIQNPLEGGRRGFLTSK